MFMVIGNIRMLANVTYLPDKKDSPQSNSIAFANGKMYTDVINPVEKTLNSSVAQVEPDQC